MHLYIICTLETADVDMGQKSVNVSEASFLNHVTLFFRLLTLLFKLVTNYLNI